MRPLNLRKKLSVLENITSLENLKAVIIYYPDKGFAEKMLNLIKKLSMLNGLNRSQWDFGAIERSYAGD